MIHIEKRASWGAKYGRGSLDPGAEELVVIHHSYRPALSPLATVAQEREAVRGIERFHVEENEWAAIGYNFLIAPSGRVYEGRGWSYSGAHAGPVNKRSIGICLLINGQVTDPTMASIWSVRSLIRIGLDEREILSSYKVGGHRDYMPRECPGDRVYARLQAFRHDAEWVGADIVIPRIEPRIVTIPPRSPVPDLRPVEARTRK